MKHNTLQDPFASKRRMANEQLQVNRVADAERILRDILRERPAHPAASFSLGMLLQRVGADKAAIEHLQAAVTAP